MRKRFAIFYIFTWIVLFGGSANGGGIPDNSSNPGYILESLDAPGDEIVIPPSVFNAHTRRFPDYEIVRFCTRGYDVKDGVLSAAILKKGTHNVLSVIDNAAVLSGVLYASVADAVLYQGDRLPSLYLSEQGDLLTVTYEDVAGNCERYDIDFSIFS